MGRADPVSSWAECWCSPTLTCDPPVCYTCHCFADQLIATDAQSLHSLWVSIGAYATVYVAVYSLSVLVWVLLGAFLFWRQSDEPMALFCSCRLVGRALSHCSKKVRPHSHLTGMRWSISCRLSVRSPLFSSFTSSRPVDLYPLDTLDSSALNRVLCVENHH